MASIEQGVSFIFCLVVDVWLVSKLHCNLLSKQSCYSYSQGLISFSMSETRYGLQDQVSFFSSLSVVTFARASNVAANRGRLCFVFSFQASPVDGSVKISFRVGSNLDIGKELMIFFGQTSFCQKWHLPRSLRQEYPPWPSWCLVLAPSARKYSSCHTWQGESSRHLLYINYQVREAPFWNVLVLYGHCPNSFRHPPLWQTGQTWKKVT